MPIEIRPIVADELEGLVLDWTAQLLGLPGGWHGHIEDTASVSTLAALAAAREATGREEVVCSQEAHSSVDKAARILGMRLRKVPCDEEFRLHPESGPVVDACLRLDQLGPVQHLAVPLLAKKIEDVARIPGFAWTEHLSI